MCPTLGTRGESGARSQTIKATTSASYTNIILAYILLLRFILYYTLAANAQQYEFWHTWKWKYMGIDTIHAYAVDVRMYVYNNTVGKYYNILYRWLRTKRRRRRRRRERWKWVVYFDLTAECCYIRIKIRYIVHRCINHRYNIIMLNLLRRGEVFHGFKCNITGYASCRVLTRIRYVYDV